MDVTTKAIALRTTDFKESDKLILLYSLEYGKLTAYARGIKKGNAKLRFAADQFCFGQYDLSYSGDRYILKSCEQLESFYSLREDIVSYYAACVVAECLASYTQDGQSEPQLFVETLKALQKLSDCCQNPLLVTLRFLLEFMRLEGFGVDFSRCAVCGERTRRQYLNLQSGQIECDKCRSEGAFLVSPRAASVCMMVDGMQYERLDGFCPPQAAVKEALDIMYRYVSHSFSPLKTLSELLKIA